MAVNKVVFEGETLIDVTDSTTGRGNLGLGTVGYTAAGERVVGEALLLSAEDKAKLIPENIRAGVVLFQGTAHEVVGSLTWQDLLPQKVVGQSGATIDGVILGGLVNTSQGTINSNGIFPGRSGNLAFSFTKEIDTNIYQAVEFTIGRVDYAVDSSTIKIGLSPAANTDYYSFSVVKQFTGVFKTGAVYRCDFNPGLKGFVKFASWNTEIWVKETALITR